MWRLQKNSPPAIAATENALRELQLKQVLKFAGSPGPPILVVGHTYGIFRTYFGVDCNPLFHHLSPGMPAYMKPQRLAYGTTAVEFLP